MKSEHRLGKGLGICCATPASEHPRVPWVLRSQWQHWPTPILSIKRYCLSCFPQLQHWYYWKYFLMFRCNYSLHSKCGWGILNFVETVFIINMKCTTSHVKSLFSLKHPQVFPPLPSQGYRIQPNFHPTAALNRSPQNCSPFRHSQRRKNKNQNWLIKEYRTGMHSPHDWDQTHRKPMSHKQL